jgi:peptidoglycan/xylan/chitin deacetylase (PgdA/CDA1 family)
MKIKIFLFHRISPVRDHLWDPIEPSHFEFIINFLNKKYTLVPLETTLLEPEKKHSKPLASVVFDDGYKDFLNYSLPILKKYHCPASMYVVTDCVSKQLPPWTYILDYHFSESKKLKLNINNDLLPSHLRINSFSNVSERISFAKQFKPFLKTIPNDQRIELYNQVTESLDDVKVHNDLIMNWTELKQIKAEGIEIGSHTQTHPLLAKIDSESDLIKEIKVSGEIIESQLGSFPLTLSYPIGSYNETVKIIAKQSGYKFGLAVNQGFYDNNMQDVFEIPRTELYNESELKTKLRISGIIQKINHWRRK